MRLCLAFIVLLPVLPAVAQPQAAPAAAQPVVTFEFDWSQGIPWQTYSIMVRADGNTHFQGTPAPDEAGGDTDLFQQDFTMSEANRSKIFDLAKKLNYFQGDFDSHLKRIAQTGSKTLEYKSATAHGSTRYNWSQNADVQELTRLFLAIANTLDYGRKLTFQYRFDKLGMDARLKELEDIRANHYVEELNAIAPILRKIADDPDMMHISRQAAQHLLRTLGGLGQPNETPAQP
ncbi:MAG: hypothetical protein ABSC64_15225 [Candidatus Korobacteraceae bacterium]|jgi:hypothetical protein